LRTILELGSKHNIPLPAWTIEELRPHVVVTSPQPGLVEFLAKFRWMVGVLADLDACRRVARENVEDAAREGLRYVELRFSPCFMAAAHQLDPTAVVGAVVEGVREGEREFGVRANLIGILTRTFGPERASVELDALLAHSSEIVALDLAGDEGSQTADRFRSHFERGRAAGWAVTVHAGEAAGAASVADAITLLGAVRIGHAVRALEDEAVVELLKKRSIGIEANLTSNVQTSTVPGYGAHPLKRFLDLGLLATINTDDPGISGIDLAHELDVAAPAAGLTEADIRTALANAWRIAFLDDAERERLLAST
jgi:adenosine deaminase